MRRCNWCNLKNEKYIEYHDKEWGIASYDDKYLYEMLILESSHEFIFNTKGIKDIAFVKFMKIN